MNEQLSPVDIALKAVQIYAETHPRPPHVTQKQACKMLGLSHPTVRSMMRSGAIKLNECGLIPITEIDRVLAAKAA
jgi:hypothetical protein